MLSLRRAAAVAGAAALVACSPTLDWRQVRPADSGLTLLLPCRPSSAARDVQLAGRKLRLVLHACSTGGQTWALAFTDVGDPAAVAAALVELLAAAKSNLGASDIKTLPLAVPGSTPNPASQRAQLIGRLPDGNAVQEQLALFSRGTQVFQATVLGAELPAEGVETFFESLRAGS